MAKVVKPTQPNPNHNNSSKGDSNTVTTGGDYYDADPVPNAEW